MIFKSINRKTVTEWYSMDWLNQNKFKNWLIVILLAVNILTVSIIWMQTATQNDPQTQDQQRRSSESVQLMKKALDLSEEQTRQLEQIRYGQMEQSKQYNDRLSQLKKELAEELFASSPDTALANQKTKEIGELQSSVEYLRFKHFNELLAMCTPEQREKLKPIVIEIFGRKPPREESKEKKPRADSGEQGRQRDTNADESRKVNKRNLQGIQPEIQRGDTARGPRDNRPQDRRDDRPAPPTLDEKLDKYSQRLRLSEEQMFKVREILEATGRKAQQLRMRPNPNRDEIETEKEKNRKEEDESIMKLLNDDQKKEFGRMISNRRK
jgi:Spy/CpxP family protein refolding chaperone